MSPSQRLYAQDDGNWNVTTLVRTWDALTLSRRPGHARFLSKRWPPLPSPACWRSNSRRRPAV